MARLVTAIEVFLLPSGGKADIAAFRAAIIEAANVCAPAMTLQISGLPVAVLMMDDAVRMIVSEIVAAGLVTEQVVIGVSETDVITQLDKFSEAVHALKAADISLSLDDFVRGSAGLSLLTRIQPDRIRIDASISSQVDRSGPARPWCRRLSNAVLHLKFW